MRLDASQDQSNQADREATEESQQKKADNTFRPQLQRRMERVSDSDALRMFHNHARQQQMDGSIGPNTISFVHEDNFDGRPNNDRNLPVNSETRIETRIIMELITPQAVEWAQDSDADSSIKRLINRGRLAELQGFARQGNCAAVFRDTGGSTYFYDRETRTATLTVPAVIPFVQDGEVKYRSGRVKNDFVACGNPLQIADAPTAAPPAPRRRPS